MNATVIDTLKFADRLKKAGFEPRQAEGLTRALGNELAERMVTKRDLDDAVQTLDTTLKTMDAKFEAKFAGLEPRFDAIDARFAGLEPRFDARFAGLEPRFDAIDARFDGLAPRFDAIDAKLASQHREFSGKFNVLLGTMALGFTLVIGLMGYSLFSPRFAGLNAGAVAIESQAVRTLPQPPALD
ncbi:MAG: hypothetical protein J4F38_10105 [Pseudomonadales bacterium]|nr:hypothetical protein [Pseudomonadales bacterium]